MPNGNIEYEGKITVKDDSDEYRELCDLFVSRKVVKISQVIFDSSYEGFVRVLDKEPREDGETTFVLKGYR